MKKNVSTDPQDTAERLFKHELKNHQLIFDAVVNDLGDDPKMLFAAAYTMGVIAALSYVSDGQIMIVNKQQSSN